MVVGYRLFQTPSTTGCFRRKISTSVSSGIRWSASNAVILQPPQQPTAPPLTIKEEKVALEGIMSPPEAYDRMVAAGAKKAKLSVKKTALMSVMAGVYIAFGGLATLMVGANLPGLEATNLGLQKLIYGAIGLPFGLLMVSVCGAELFTGNTACVTAALHEGKATVRQLAKNWVVSYLGNLVGASLVAALVVVGGVNAAHAGAAKLAVVKTSLPFMQALVRGILCNFMVCVAYTQGMAANDLTGKFLGILIPVTIFSACGLEHSIANMFMVPMGVVAGAITYQTFLVANLLPVTLGNIIGGALGVATPYAFIYGRKARALE